MRRMTLTPAINLAYANPITATSVIWISLQHNQQKRPGAHLKRFFCAYCFMVGCVGASSDAAVLLPAKANPAQPATLLISLKHGGSSKLQKETTMNVFTVRSSATLPELAEQARINSVQSHQLIETINHLSQDRDSFPEQFQRITNLSWLLQSLLEQQEMLCEQLESAAFEGVQV